MICRKLMTRMFLVGSVVGAMLSAVTISGCTVDTGLRDGRDSDRMPRKVEASPGEKETTLEVSIAADAKATNPMENTALKVRVVVRVLTAVERPVKPLCRARSSRSHSRGTVFSAD